MAGKYEFQRPGRPKPAAMANRLWQRQSSRLGCSMVAIVFSLSLGTWGHAQEIREEFAGTLSLSDIGGGMFGTRSDVTQMALIDGPSATQKYLFVSSNQHGIRRATYDMDSKSLVAGSLIDVATDINGLGVAFHGSTMYASDFYESSNDGSVKLSRLWKIEDFGTGTRTAIVQGIPRDDHGVNQIQIVDNSLYVGIGVRTRNGAFQAFGGDDYGESAYGGSIAVIDDLDQVGSGDNAAGFFPANPTASQYRDLINGSDPLASSPFTSTDPGKLRVHSSGTRNPFGVTVDGDGEIWFTNNFQRVDNGVYDRDNLASAEGDGWSGNGFQDDIHDQIFKAETKADYGYRNGNWQNGNLAGNTEAVDAGFYAASNRKASFTFDNYVDPAAADEKDGQNPAYNEDYVMNDPVGLGPSSSANGFAFYQANELPLQFHQDAFVTRWNGVIQDDVDILSYRDIVSVDRDTGDVSRIAFGFKNPLDIIEDGSGGLIVADFGGSIYAISATNAFDDAHPLSWDSDQDGAWSDRLQWNTNSLDPDDRIVPHQWGTARYAVSIVRPAVDVTVTLDRDARVESVQLTETLQLSNGHTLTVDQGLEILIKGSLAGHGAVDGRVVNSGSVVPGSEGISIGTYQQDANGQLIIDFVSSPNANLNVIQDAEIGGALNIQFDLSSLAVDEPFQTDVLTAATITGAFSDFRVNQLVPGTNGHIQFGRFADVQVNETAVGLQIFRAVAGDSNGDGRFDSRDLVGVLAAGKYEDGVPSNADWTEGDWDGNQDFDSSDLIRALSVGAYQTDARPIHVPEPRSLSLALIGLLAWFRRRPIR